MLSSGISGRELISGRDRRDDRDGRDGKEGGQSIWSGRDNYRGNSGRD
jgi:hypothetical protein